MKGVDDIFKKAELSYYQRLLKLKSEMDTKHNNIVGEDVRLFYLNFILQTLRSYKPAPNGIQWSKEEKEKFKNLSYKEQRKMIVKKSEIKSSLFPYVSVDYEPYTYSPRISDRAKTSYNKAQELLKKHEKTYFNDITPLTQQEILNNLRIAYNERYLKAGVELASLLFKKSSLKGGDEAKKDIIECASITKALLDEKIGENSYMYYQLYKWCIDSDRIYLRDLGTSSLGVNKEQALECYNHALESIVWEAIDEEAQRKSNKLSLIGAELYLAAAIKYQSPAAFLAAASNYCPTGVEWTLYYAIIPFHACTRCAIALGGGGIDTLIDFYRQGFDFPKSPLKAARLQNYRDKPKSQKGLINGLDPYFDEKFPPDTLIDLSSKVESCVYGGRWGSFGMSYATKIGVIKDPRDKDSTKESIKEYYLMMWRIVVGNSKEFRYRGIGLLHAFSIMLYSNLTYGLPSARPYIFPKEVLDLEIDFNKGLEGVDQERK